MDALIVPCYNEEKRLAMSELQALLAGKKDLDIFLVDDGSTDGTKALLQRLGANSRLKIVLLHENVGKAEAVRQGLLDATEDGYEWVGYADADFATPAYEMLRLFEIARANPVDVVMGSRVRLLGNRVERSLFRNYVGRIFATLASSALHLRVYDTQCGAKLFRRGPALDSALSREFHSRWAFDVELIGRLMRAFGADGAQRFKEVALEEWRDVKGSKLGMKAMLKAGLDLFSIAWRVRRGTI